MSRLPDATSRRVLIPISGFGEPTKDYLLAAANAGLPPVAAVKALLDRAAVRRDSPEPQSAAPDSRVSSEQ
ncbi:hypothetical protein OJ996_22010 [Luteolibacter sp. GHJ8]|uniref:Uncharacterized protein n=1 Tax=Luteolibacter rhizosphaerae TaxID=2989719 RepID=A0ABT3GAL9_9BACT|nr:hypothetical protein [Luteolibacter rhizosphaerae]MCW1916280.1 hypothetical protein [Luteolibacter rhizosphaerae]